MTDSQADLSKKLKQYYHSQKMDLSKVRSLMAKTARQPKNQLPQWGLAMGGAICLSLWFFFTTLPLPHTMAKQMLSNHQKHEKLTVLTSNIQMVTQKLPLKNIKIQTLPIELLKTHQLVGAKYCKVLNHKALQVRLKHKITKASQTLFITANHPDFDSLNAPQTLSISTAHIKIWKAQGKIWGWVQTP